MEIQHSNKHNPHALALALPISHTGTNPPYSFLTLHPTPHAQRHDLYVQQPQCYRLVRNNTFVFTVRQHPASLNLHRNSDREKDGKEGGNRAQSPAPFARPTSALSITSFSATGSSYSNPSNPSTTSSSSGSSGANIKPAKLAIQSPSGKIIRLVRKSEAMGGGGNGGGGMGSTWETVIKVSEVGQWRGLVLADRSARWCVFGVWECV